jgi:hypothetical protein
MAPETANAAHPGQDVNGVLQQDQLVERIGGVTTALHDSPQDLSLREQDNLDALLLADLDRRLEEDVANRRRVYEASLLKRRRSTKQQVANLWGDLYEIVGMMKPMTVRQVFYQATVKGVVEKTEAGYTKVQRALAQMRKAGEMPYDWLADNTRWQRKPKSYDSVEEALLHTAQFYRKDLWRSADSYVEIWLEKDALSGVIFPTTKEWDVPLMVARGYASLSFLHTAAEAISELEVPAYIYHLGDFDPSGVNAGEKIEETLRELAPDAEIHFERLAVLPSQIARWNLPSRPTKMSDTRSKNFGAISVELDAIEPDALRALVLSAIERHLPQHQYEVLKVAEQSERELLRSFIAGTV